MCPHPYEGVQTKRLSWENAGPSEVARDSCLNTPSETITAWEGPKTLIQDAYLLSLRERDGGRGMYVDYAGDL